MLLLLLLPVLLTCIFHGACPLHVLQLLELTGTKLFRLLIMRNHAFTICSDSLSFASGIGDSRFLFTLFLLISLKVLQGSFQEKANCRSRCSPQRLRGGLGCPAHIREAALDAGFWLQLRACGIWEAVVVFRAARLLPLTRETCTGLPAPGFGPSPAAASVLGVKQQMGSLAPSVPPLPL